MFMPVLPKAILCWSSGKDSAFALHVVRSAGEAEVVGLLTTVTRPYDRVSMHGVREELLDRQAEELGLACVKIDIPSPCSNEFYDQEMTRALLGFKAQGVTRVVFGDIFLEDIRKYREARLAEVGLEAVFPLWMRNTAELARDMLAIGFQAVVTCVDSSKLDCSFAGRLFDERLLASLPAGVDPCGENGEFHTFVHAGPMFRRPISVVAGEVVEREGYIFSDLTPLPPLHDMERGGRRPG